MIQEAHEDDAEDEGEEEAKREAPKKQKGLFGKLGDQISTKLYKASRINKKEFKK